MTGQALRVVVAEGAPEEEWHDGRDGMVTASDIHRIAQGGRGTHRQVLDEKLNGRKFRGNAHTRRGHVREPELLHFAAHHIAPGRGIRPNTALYGHPVHLLHGATPDGLGWDADEAGLFGVEVKSHDASWDSDQIPADHLDQMLFGMWVLGADHWLYVWEVMGSDGEPTLDDPRHMWVHRRDHEARIARLAAEADLFLAWRDAGAPELDDIPDEVDDALAVDARFAAIESHAKRERKSARAVIDPWLEAQGEKTVRATGTRAEIVRTTDEVRVLDEERWKAADPEGFAAFEGLRQQARDAEEYAALTFVECDALAAAAISVGHRTTEIKYGNVRVSARKGLAA
ncbi:YqaJ viral recombinase family protein [Microbacterium rhizomatis]|uniref:YqaJ viral recombinase family protein n=1 Tax=Microbacterium rhizomatis TaxID=1631477 RepID=UPI001B8684F4|nr:YqaJ viral recombinase family protein [Microbacterium rhizomatis]